MQLRELIRSRLIGARVLLLNRLWKFNISRTAIVSFSAYLDKTYPQGVHVGEHSLVARGAMVLSHDYTRSLRAETRIGSHCMVGANAVILPGITIGDQVVVGAGSVVVRDVPSNSLVAGNPARIIRQIITGPYGKIISEMEKG